MVSKAERAKLKKAEEKKKKEEVERKKAAAAPKAELGGVGDAAPVFVPGGAVSPPTSSVACVTC